MHCPYCGSSIREKESFCAICGRKLPEDLEHRMIPNRKFNKLWIVPIGIVIFFILSSVILYIYLENRSTRAQEFYNQAEEKLLTGEFAAAEQLFNEALYLKSNFSQADTSLLFTKRAIKIQS